METDVEGGGMTFLINSTIEQHLFEHVFRPLRDNLQCIRGLNGKDRTKTVEHVEY